MHDNQTVKISNARELMGSWTASLGWKLWGLVMWAITITAKAYSIKSVIYDFSTYHFNYESISA